ncbi:MAG: hypothetical protein N2745_01780, partial [Syntrophorhabdaceae bacterium]|nr:hypothetical protein [Syntrophorhabdaceae bacterium]
MREKELTFTIMEATRFSIINATRTGKMTLKEVSLALNVSVRQIIRIKKNVEEKGPSGIIHGNRGIPSKKTHPLRDHIILLATEKY